MIDDPQGEFQGLPVDSTTLDGSELSLDGEVDDERASDLSDGWDIYRDLPPGADTIRGKQILACAAELLGQDFLTLTAVVDRGWTASMVGETQGYAADSATARACGIGMLRSALRNLAEFFVKLDRAENGERPIRNIRPARRKGFQMGYSVGIWSLVGTPLWIFDGIPAAWLKAKQRNPANDNEETTPKARVVGN